MNLCKYVLSVYIVFRIVNTLTLLFYSFFQHTARLNSKINAKFYLKLEVVRILQVQQPAALLQEEEEGARILN